MPYDRTKTEAAALGMIDESVVVMLGPIEVPYLAFRKSELRRVAEFVNDPEGMLTAIYELANYRLRGTMPRDEFDEWVSLDAAMAYFLANRGGEKKVKAQASSTTGAS